MENRAFAPKEQMLYFPYYFQIHDSSKAPRIPASVPGPHGPLVAVGEQIVPALLKGSITLFSSLILNNR